MQGACLRAVTGLHWTEKGRHEVTAYSRATALFPLLCYSRTSRKEGLVGGMPSNGVDFFPVALEALQLAIHAELEEPTRRIPPPGEEPIAIPVKMHCIYLILMPIVCAHLDATAGVPKPHLQETPSLSSSQPSLLLPHCACKWLPGACID
jgi:hypothetical protein